MFEGPHQGISAAGKQVGTNCPGVGAPARRSKALSSNAVSICFSVSERVSFVKVPLHKARQPEPESWFEPSGTGREASVLAISRWLFLIEVGSTSLRGTSVSPRNAWKCLFVTDHEPCFLSAHKLMTKKYAPSLGRTGMLDGSLTFGLGGKSGWTSSSMRLKLFARLLYAVFRVLKLGHRNGSSESRSQAG